MFIWPTSNWYNSAEDIGLLVAMDIVNVLIFWNGSLYGAILFAFKSYFLSWKFINEMQTFLVFFNTIIHIFKKMVFTHSKVKGRNNLHNVVLYT